jgi:hypothetical protein
MVTIPANWTASQVAGAFVGLIPRTELAARVHWNITSLVSVQVCRQMSLLGYFQVRQLERKEEMRA